MSDTPAQDFAVEPLDPAQVRVLGSLVEKEFTTPDNYPLSVNALTSACNQSSNREPVMALAEDDVRAALRTLTDRLLAREVHRSDARVKRYRHLLAETLHLHPPELAALCVLMLRGPQTVGEIKGRTGRMVEFVDLSHVELTLQSLATLPVPLVLQLPRQPGQKEARYAHMLAGEPELPDPAVSPYESSAKTEEPEATGRMDTLEEEVRTLRAELEELRQRFDAFRSEFQ